MGTAGLCSNPFSPVLWFTDKVANRYDTVKHVGTYGPRGTAASKAAQACCRGVPSFRPH